MLMLYEGAAKFLERAINGFDIDDPAESNEAINNNILRAQAIIFELNVTLNMNEGGDIAKTLRSLYDYMDRRLLEANLKKDKIVVKEICDRVLVLRDAWAQMLGNQGAAAVEEAGVLAAA